MRAVTRFAAFMALVYAGASAAAAPAVPKPDLARGQQIATTVCAACHGADGVSTLPANPHLAGQGADYIAAQLAAFKSGARPNPVMQGMAAGLTPEDMLAVGAYYHSQKPVQGVARDKALSERGQRISKRKSRAHIDACMALAYAAELASTRDDLEVPWLEVV